MPDSAGGAAPRLIELAPFDREEGGSFVPQLASICSEAGSRGWRAEVVLPESARACDWVSDIESSGAKIHFAPPIARRGRPAWLSSLLGSDGARTVMHSHFTTWDLAVAKVAHGDPHRFAYWHVHTVLNSDPISLARHLLKFTLVGRRVDGVFCPAVNIGDALRHRGIPAGEIRVIPSGIDPDSFPLLTENDRQASREALGLPQESTVLLHFGWDWSIKGGDLFLAATQELLRRDGEDLIALAQRGGEKAQAKAKELGIEDHVRVIGMVSDVHQLFGAADVFLAVSAREGMPYSVLESVCSGTPVVASDLPGHAVVAESVPACTLVHRDAADIADAVQAFLQASPETRASQASTSREWITKHFSAERSAELLLDVFEGRT